MLWAFLAWWLLSLPLTAQHAGLVRRGELDLRTWNKEQYPVVSLDGEWEFYWHQLLTGGESSYEQPHFAVLSRPWNEQPIMQETLPRDGFATYHLRVFIPRGMDSVALAVPAVFNSYALYADGVLICKSGNVADTEKEQEPRWQPQTVVVPLKGQTLNLYFQIANFQHTRGGCAEVMRLGTVEYLLPLSRLFHQSGWTLMIVFFIVSVISAAAFVWHGQKNFLYLSLLSFAFILRFLFSDLYFYRDLELELSWMVAARLEYLTIPLLLLCAVFFLQGIYPKEVHRSIKIFYIVANLLMAGLVLILPSVAFTQLLIMSQVIGLSFIVIAIITITRAIVRDRAGAWVSAVGLITLACVGFYNIYTFINVIDMNRVVIHAGYLLAMLMNVISLMYRTPMTLSDEDEFVMRYEDYFGVSRKT